MKYLTADTPLLLAHTTEFGNPNPPWPFRLTLWTAFLKRLEALRNAESASPNRRPPDWSVNCSTWLLSQPACRNVSSCFPTKSRSSVRKSSRQISRLIRSKTKWLLPWGMHRLMTIAIFFKTAQLIMPIRRVKIIRAHNNRRSCLSKHLLSGATLSSKTTLSPTCESTHRLVQCWIRRHSSNSSPSKVSAPSTFRD